MGQYALSENTTGFSNTAIGDWALISNTTGSSNTAVGDGAGYLVQTGIDNVFVGDDAGANASASYNTILGCEAGYSNTGGSGVFIGYQAGYSETGANKLYIDNSGTATPLIYGDFGTDELIFNGAVSISANVDLGDSVTNDIVSANAIFRIGRISSTSLPSCVSALDSGIVNIYDSNDCAAAGGASGDGVICICTAESSSWEVVGDY